MGAIDSLAREQAASFADEFNARQEEKIKALEARVAALDSVAIELLKSFTEDAYGNCDWSIDAELRLRALVSEAPVMTHGTALVAGFIAHEGSPEVVDTASVPKLAYSFDANGSPLS